MLAAPRAANTSPRKQDVLARLKKRADFKAAAKGVKVAGRLRDCAPFAVQAVRRTAATGDDVARVGFTVTKRVGNAVERNRIKRRLRAAADARAGDFVAATDYVLIARRDALTAPFPVLCDGLGAALASAARRLEASHRMPADGQKA